MKARLSVTLIVPLALAAAALLVAGCGDDKPEYCADVSDLQQSVDDLKKIQLEAGVLTALQADLQKIQSNVNAVVTSAKQDFPSQTSALQSSVSTLSTSIDQLPPSPTAKQLLPLATQIDRAAAAAKDLKSATDSACD